MGKVIYWRGGLGIDCESTESFYPQNRAFDVTREIILITKKTEIRPKFEWKSEHFLCLYLRNRTLRSVVKILIIKTQKIGQNLNDNQKYSFVYTRKSVFSTSRKNIEHKNAENCPKFERKAENFPLLVEVYPCEIFHQHTHVMVVTLKVL